MTRAAEIFMEAYLVIIWFFLWTFAEFEFIDAPKNSLIMIDFLISAIGKVQKGQRLALGLDDDVVVNEEPKINVVEGLCEGKI